MNPEQNAKRLAQAISLAKVPLDQETGAGMLAIGVALLRMGGLSLPDLLSLVRHFYQGMPDVARAALKDEP